MFHSNHTHPRPDTNQSRDAGSLVTPSTPLFGRILGFVYALLAYLGFFASFGSFVLTTMGYSAQWGLSLAPQVHSVGLALLLNVALVLGFAAQHTIMARPAFKQWWTQWVPRALERATFVWASNLALAAVSLFWTQVPGSVWSVSDPALDGGLWLLGLLGWSSVAGASFLIDHFELFGLRQAYTWLRGVPMPRNTFRTPGAYKVIRHPMMLGMLVGLWATPDMDVVRLVLSVTMTLYILAGVRFEESDLVRLFPKQYPAYRRQVPALLPAPHKWARLRSQERSARPSSESVASSSAL